MAAGRGRAATRVTASREHWCVCLRVRFGDAWAHQHGGWRSVRRPEHGGWGAVRGVPFSLSCLVALLPFFVLALRGPAVCDGFDSDRPRRRPSGVLMLVV